MKHNKGTAWPKHVRCWYNLQLFTRRGKIWWNRVYCSCASNLHVVVFFCNKLCLGSKQCEIWSSFRGNCTVCHTIWYSTLRLGALNDSLFYVTCMLRNCWVRNKPWPSKIVIILMTDGELNLFCQVMCSSLLFFLSLYTKDMATFPNTVDRWSFSESPSCWQYLTAFPHAISQYIPIRTWWAYLHRHFILSQALPRVRTALISEISRSTRNLDYDQSTLKLRIRSLNYFRI